MQTLQAYTSAVQALSFSSDGVYLASVGPQHSRVVLWHRTTGRLTNRADSRLVGRKEARRRTSRPNISTATFAPKGPALAAVFGASLGLWADGLHSNEIITLRQPGDPLHVGEIAFSPDGTVLAFSATVRAAQSKHGLRRVSSDSCEPIGEPIELPLRETARNCLAWSPDGVHLAVAGWAAGSQGAFAVHLIRASDFARTAIFPLPGVPDTLAFSADGRTLAVATYSVIRRWDIADREPLPALMGHAKAITGLVGLADGRWMSANQDGTVRTWDDASEKCIDVKDWQLGELTTLAVARDGMRAAVGSKTGTILVWDID
jgi:WD40 repeat protein